MGAGANCLVNDTRSSPITHLTITTITLRELPSSHFPFTRLYAQIFLLPLLGRRETCLSLHFPCLSQLSNLR